MSRYAPSPLRLSLLSGVLGLVVLTAAPAVVFAQTSANASTPSVRDTHSPGFRFGVEGGAGFALGRPSVFPPVEELVVPTLHLDMGVRMTRNAAIYLRGELGLSPPGLDRGLGHAAAYMVGEWTPWRWLSLGTGLGYDAFTVFWVAQCARAGACDGNSWSGLSVPLILAFNVMRRDRWEAPGTHRAFRIGLETAGGFSPWNGVFGWHAAVTCGLAVM